MSRIFLEQAQQKFDSAARLAAYGPSNNSQSERERYLALAVQELAYASSYMMRGLQDMHYSLGVVQQGVQDMRDMMTRMDATGRR